MKVETNVIGNALLIVAHILNGLSPSGGEGKFYLAIAIGILQIFLSVIAHYSNPNGTPVAEPYGLTDAQLAEYKRIFDSAKK